MKIPQAADILASPGTSYWLKDAIKKSFDRDAVDALRDAELLVMLLKKRYADAIREYEDTLRDDGFNKKEAI